MVDICEIVRGQFIEVEALLDHIALHIAVPNAHPAPQWTLREAYRHCITVAHSHYENFPVVSFFLRRSERRALAAFYTFARLADDIADRPDLPLTTSQRLAALDRLEAAIAQRQPVHPFLEAVYDTMERHQIPPSIFHRLLVAFRYDLDFRPFPSWKQLQWYCHHSADPVGEAVLLIARQHRRSMLPFSDALCTALQLINFWQDLTTDRQRHRCYIPEEVLNTVNASVEDFYYQRLTHSQQHHILKQVLEMTQRFLSKATILPELLTGRWRLFLRLILGGASAMVEKLQAAGTRLFVADRILLHNRDFLRIFTNGIKRRAK